MLKMNHYDKIFQVYSQAGLMKMANDRVKELKSLVMVIHTLANGRMTKLMVMENSWKLMADITMENGTKIWLKDRDVNTLLKLDARTLESGIKIFNMAIAQNDGYGKEEWPDNACYEGNY